VIADGNRDDAVMAVNLELVVRSGFGGVDGALEEDYEESEGDTPPDHIFELHDLVQPFGFNRFASDEQAERFLVHRIDDIHPVSGSTFIPLLASQLLPLHDSGRASGLLSGCGERLVEVEVGAGFTFKDHVGEGLAEAVEFDVSEVVASLLGEAACF